MGLISSVKLSSVSFGPKNFHLPLVSKHPQASLTMGLLELSGLVLPLHSSPAPRDTCNDLPVNSDLSFSNPRGLLHTKAPGKEHGPGSNLG